MIGADREQENSRLLHVVPSKHDRFLARTGAMRWSLTQRLARTASTLTIRQVHGADPLLPSCLQWPASSVEYLHTGRVRLSFQ